MCPRIRDHLGGRNRIKSARALFLSTDTWTLSTEVWFAAPLNRDQPRKRLLYVDGISLSTRTTGGDHILNAVTGRLGQRVIAAVAAGLLQKL